MPIPDVAALSSSTPGHLLYSVAFFVVDAKNCGFCVEKVLQSVVDFEIFTA
jgi:hypothetical protein